MTVRNRNSNPSRDAARRFQAFAWASAIVLAAMVGRASGQEFVDDNDGLLDVGEAPGYPQRPSAYSDELDLAHLSIQDLDGTNLLTRTTGLDLSQNLIESIDENDFRELSIRRYLRLGQNNISSIAPGAFSDLSDLDALELYGNALDHLDASFFKGLGRLGELRIHDNQITSIEPGDFDEVPNLHELRLGGNAITSIDPGDLRNLPRLSFLDLADNAIGDIQPESFAGLGLFRLWLQGNQIASVEPGDFAHVGSLHFLDLGRNAISSIESGDFEGLPDLVRLKIEGNKLTSIEPSDFDHIRNIQYLILDDNDIAEVDPGDFDALPNLQNLGLGGNGILEIDRGVFSTVETLTSITLDGNPLTRIAPGAFEGLRSLSSLFLHDSDLTELDFRRATFESLRPKGYALSPYGLWVDHEEIETVLLDDAQLSLETFDAIFSETFYGDDLAVKEASLVGLNFSDKQPESLATLLDIATLDAVRVDPELYSAYEDEFLAFSAVPGNSVTIVPEVLGDADSNGTVDLADFRWLRDSFGTDDPFVDFDENGLVDLTDFQALKESFGTVSAVPEPTSWILAACCIGLATRAFRKAQGSPAVAG